MLLPGTIIKRYMRHLVWGIVLLGNGVASSRHRKLRSEFGRYSLNNVCVYVCVQACVCGGQGMLQWWSAAVGSVVLGCSANTLPSEGIGPGLNWALNRSQLTQDSLSLSLSFSRFCSLLRLSVCLSFFLSHSISLSLFLGLYLSLAGPHELLCPHLLSRVLMGRRCNGVWRLLPLPPFGPALCPLPVPNSLTLTLFCLSVFFLHFHCIALSISLFSLSLYLF